MDFMEGKKHIGKIEKVGKAGKVGKIIISILGTLAALVILLQMILWTSIPTNLINKYAASFVDGNMTFGKVEVSVLKRFPNIGVSLSDFSITYPSDRYDESEKAGVQGHLLWSGCGEDADTLASFSNFSAYINIFRLASGTIKVKEIEMVRPRIFIHRYADGKSNLDIFRFTAAEDDTESGSIPPAIIGKLDLFEHPHIVYTDCSDTLFALINIKQLNFDGLIDTQKPSRWRVGMNMDSMFVAGRMGKDTIALGMDMLKIADHKKHYDISAKAKTFAATRTYGRMMIPVGIHAGLSIPKDSVPALSISHFDLDIASLELSGEARIKFHKDSLWTDSRIAIQECNIDSLLRDLIKPFVPEAGKVSTNALLSAEASINGGYVYESGRLPQMSMTISLPESDISYSDFPQSVKVALQASAQTDSSRRINAVVKKAYLNTEGFELSANGCISDALSEDPELGIHGMVKADIDTIASVFIPDSTGIRAKGFLNAEINGNARLSQLNIYNFAHSSLEGNACCKGLEIVSEKDSISMVINDLDVSLGPEVRTRRSDPKKKVRLIALLGTVDSTYISYKKSFEVNARDVRFAARNSSGTSSGANDTTAIKPLSISVSANRLSVKDAVSTSLALDNTENRFLLLPKKEHNDIPVMRVSSQNKRIFLMNTNNRIILTDASLKATAAMNTIERKQRAKAFADSLAMVYPDIPRDSLFAHARAQRTAKPLPDWMKEEDFVKGDPDLKLEESLAKYFREWDLDGRLDVRTGILMTPYFPLRNLLKGCYVSFNNDKISIDSLGFASGESRLAAKGALTGIKKVLLGRRNSMLNLDVDITSDGMNANELLRAYSAGSKYIPPEEGNIEGISNSEFLKMVTSEGNQEKETETSLIVVPGNIKADISVDAENIRYSDLEVDKATARLLMKERCVQITDTKAITNAGDISLDAFYSTRSKKDLKTGFDINFKDITAEKVVNLMPAIDTIMPMLKSFTGLLNCEVAATSDLDTNMNIVMPSINGVMRISGKNLTISENEMFHTLAKKLLFKNRKTGFIDDMTVEGIINDNKLEVFPFVMKIDRYTLAMSGIQNLDMSFKYHVSVLKSPFLFRIGINLFGDDFDNMKFKIGKAQYKNTNIPVFSSVIDDTKINLINSIRGIFKKGVEAAFAENINQQKAIDLEKSRMGYENAAAKELEPLSEKEQEQMEAEEAAQEETAQEAAQEEAAQEEAAQEEAQSSTEGEE